MAVCNSSLESSEKGLEAYDLRDAEAFDSVEAMCKSDTVSLVVCAAEDLSKLAQKKGIRTVIGLQAGVSPAYVALAKVLESGRIGRPLATHISGSACTEETGKDIVKRYKCFKDRDTEGVTGQVMLSIYLGHTFQPVVQLLGEPTTLRTQMRTTWPKINVMDQDQVIESDVTKTADDYVSLQGETESGVAFTYCFRGGGAFDKGEGLV
ncbi:uncharacterized protein BKA55DRAFT_691503 [Fusarium redolens]|uniref:Gal80p-like C-terminal domain-containing protein n=1 Tax=Fusarium redolens TaxID=48865 RepID=A0A9P9K837_FUSRE|nr:uncharacterized protein BKA55DRAFT_691503 [Fusarium redolens]KAH7247425.1 hypothetical protein BKA55DRAFT_691503 [Fusarium redolens]